MTRNPHDFESKIIHVGTPGIFHWLAPGLPLRTRCGIDAENSRQTDHRLDDMQPCAVCWEFAIGVVTQP